MLQKWISRRRAAAQTVVSSPADDAPAAANDAAPAVAQRIHDSWLVVRRPLIDRTGGIAGWDIQLSSRASERLARADAPRVLRETYFFALVQAAREAMAGSRRAVVALPEAACNLELLAPLPARTILRLGWAQYRQLGQQEPDWAKRTEARGLLVAAEIPPGAPQDCTYVLVDAAQTACSLGPQPGAGQRWIAMNLPDYEAVGEAVRNGAELCCGNFVVAARRPAATHVPPVVINAANILSAIIAGRSVRDIAEQFKLDMSLSHRLLQATRSAALALSRPLESIQEAVMMLGVRELYRWLSVLLMSADSRSTIAAALHETALTRGRLLELLAKASPRGDPPEQLFVVGTFSLLDLILGVPIETALALAPLPEAATEALIAKSGPWQPYLRVALALEAGDPSALEAASRDLAVGVDDAIELNRQAHTWAAQTIADLHRPPK